MIQKDSVHPILDQTRPVDLLLTVDIGAPAEVEEVVRTFQSERVVYCATEGNLGGCSGCGFLEVRPEVRSDLHDAAGASHRGWVSASHGTNRGTQGEVRLLVHTL